MTNFEGKSRIIILTVKIESSPPVFKIEISGITQKNVLCAVQCVKKRRNWFRIARLLFFKCYYFVHFVFFGVVIALLKTKRTKKENRPLNGWYWNHRRLLNKRVCHSIVCQNCIIFTEKIIKEFFLLREEINQNKRFRDH